MVTAASMRPKAMSPKIAPDTECVPLVFVEEKYLGDVMSDLSGKREKILGQDSTGGIAEIRIVQDSGV